MKSEKLPIGGSPCSPRVASKWEAPGSNKILDLGHFLDFREVKKQLRPARTTPILPTPPQTPPSGDRPVEAVELRVKLDDGGRETDDSRRNSRESPSRRVSFKVAHRSSSASRRNKHLETRVTLTSNKVAELASKFNSLHSSAKKSASDSSAIKCVVIPQNTKIPADIKLLKLTRKCSNNLRKDSSTSSVTGKIVSCRKPLEEKISVTKLPNGKERKRCKPTATLGGGSVKAAIQIFEQNSRIVERCGKSATTQCTGFAKVQEYQVAKNECKDAVVKEKPKYSKVVFKRNSKLVLLDCEDIDDHSATGNTTNVPEKVVGTTTEVTKDLHNRLDCDHRRETSASVTISQCKRNSKVDNNESDFTNSTKKGEKLTILCNNRTDTIKDVETENRDRKCEKAQLKETGAHDIKSGHTLTVKVKSRSSQLSDDVGSTSTNHKKQGETSPSADTNVPDSRELQKTPEVEEDNLTPNENLNADSNNGVELARGNETSEVVSTSGEETSMLPMKPNSSFLWGSRPPVVASSVTGVGKGEFHAVNALVTGAQKARSKSAFTIQLDVDPGPTESSTDPYDDVYPPVATHHSYSSLEEPVYDDVGVKGPEDDGYDYCATAPSCDGYQSISDSNIYDDVLTRIPDCVSDCYESIYDGRPASKRVTELSPPGSSLGSARESSCDQTNSLYGMAESSGSQASTVPVDAPHEVLSYQLTLLGGSQPRSETSDEWVDMDVSDSDGEPGTLVVLKGLARSRRSPTWSSKVRKWSTKTPRKFADISDNGDQSTDSETAHHYEMLYEVVNNKNVSEIPPCLDSDSSFDSDISESVYMKPQANYDIGNGQLPDPPSGQNIYGITKIAEAAGKKMMKLGKSLRNIRTKRNNTIQVKLDVLPSPQPPSSPPPLPPVPPRMEKASSSGSLSQRRKWFRRSLSSASQNTTSTFYLTHSVNADTGIVEPRRPSDGCSENGDVPTSPSSAGSTTTLVGTASVPDRTTKRVTRPGPERRASAPVRPLSPPPLPPDIPKRPVRKEKRNSNTSWYAECGLFDRTDGPTYSNLELPKRTPVKPACNSWYAEAGLWDVSGSSHANDSSMSEHDSGQHTDVSDCSASQENSADRMFAGEPLYQFYAASVAELVKRVIHSDLDSDGYEEIGDGMVKVSARPSAMELIQPRKGQHRTLWCEIPEVVNSGTLDTMNNHQKKLQEAKFEIISSEASYANSLSVLEKHFISSTELTDESVLSKNDRRTLFFNVTPVRSCSSKFLADLEHCWQDNILLHGICDVIYRHATHHFSSYIKYCSNQIYLDRTLRKLREQPGKFAECLSRLEGSPRCQSLSLHSFLMLPMQRITRLPLLVDAVLTRLDPADDEYHTCQLALATLNKIVRDCNEGARQMERMEEILILSRQLDFSREVKPVPIISSSRWLVKNGELTQLVWRGDEGKLTFGKKFSKTTLHVFLFTDLLIITKKKSEDSYTVVDYCPRNMVQMTSTEGISHLPVKFSSDGGKHLMLLTMLHNHEKKTVEMMLSCTLESDRQRWLEAVTPPTSTNPDERVYEEWDCPQVTAEHAYTAQQPDELSLDAGDVVNVLRKMPDGWYQGERIRDGERGWFPGNYTVEVASAHVRARNLKQRYRLLALSGNYLDSQTKAK